MIKILLYIFIVIWLINLSRICIYLLGSDLYALRDSRAKKPKRRWHYPFISVIVPAHNEQETIVRNLTSVYESNYPAKKLELIVVNDGSTDNTKEVVRQFQRTHRGRCKIRLINRVNKGKANALNYVMRYCVKGNLIMCLDADSYLDVNALRSAAQHFRDRNVVALSANVNIIEDGTLLALAQKIEYLIGYHMKKGQDYIGIDYIIGGIGSMFRKNMLKKVAYYDTNTMTEDIDLTMKIIVKKNKKQRIAYAADCVAYTEAVHTIKALTRQRLRWKYGRSQTFYKNSFLFFSRDKQYQKRLTWFMMPFVLFQDLIFTLEPAIIVYFLLVAFSYNDIHIFTSAVIFFTSFVLFNVWSSDHLSFRERARLTYYAPPMYFLIYLTTVADYFALLRGTAMLPKLSKSIKVRQHIWSSPKRLTINPEVSR